MNEDGLDPVVAASVQQRNFERRVRTNDPARKTRRLLWFVAVAGTITSLFALSLVDGAVGAVAGLALTVVVIALGATLYFVPTIVASTRQHRNRLAITVLNLFLGWTFVGWAIALVWACTANTTKV